MASDEGLTQRPTREQLRTGPVAWDRDHPEEDADEEASLQRRARFGMLPDLGGPRDWVEEDGTDSPYVPPDSPYDPRVGGGGDAG